MREAVYFQVQIGCTLGNHDSEQRIQIHIYPLADTLYIICLIGQIPAGSHA
jgi:hypothetical protein